ncbi:12195_t:CDS:1 [Funneliformis caledonium]|uniref:12195_t:CDS:1 n=1 Tax=Funneliformis caledonium TaxID=1117310 RepID=A0A9N9DU40_9GLOM|nr:12195_t:CDS:1 [Funneliformis caledonium]
MNHFHSLSLDWNDTEFNWIRYCTNKRSRNDDLDVEIRVKLTNHFHIIEKEIYKLLMGSCLIVKNLDTGNVMEHSETPMYYYYLTRTNVSLGNLTVLCCDSNIDHTFFHELAHACSLLQRLHIFNCNSDNPGLARLIEVQKNLKYLACLTDYDAEMLIVPPLEAIGSALITQADSLVHFKFVYNLEFFLPLNILTELSSNLQRLDLINFNIDYGDSRSEQMYNNHKFEELLKLTTFSKLEVFKVGIINLDVAIKVIEQTEGNLSEVLLGYSDYNERYSGSYIRAIYECCPKIQILSLGINKGDFKEFENLLIKCQQIQRMVIETYNFDDDHIKLILEILLKSSPKTLREIRISWRYCKTDLKSFLENWKDRVRITLYFFVENHYEKYYFDMNYSKVLDHFREVGVVKAYRYDDMYQNFYMLN